MAQTLDMKNAEKQVFRLATFEDGIWEIYLGLFFTMMSLYPVTRELLGPALNAVLILGITILLATAGLMAKKRIILPRTGLVKFGPKTHKKIKAANIITLGLVIATFILVILGANSLIKVPISALSRQWLSDFSIDLIFALIIVGIFCLIAYYTGLARFYLHGVLLGAGNFATAVLHVNFNVQFGWPIALAGLIIALIGVSILMKFLQEYPIPIEESPDGR